MAVRTWLYLCRLGLKNLWHNKVYAAASVITMASCIFLFGIFYIAVLNVDAVLQKTEEEVYVAVFFEKDVLPERVDEIGNLIRLRPEVIRTVYTSADDAWSSFRSDHFENRDVLEGIFEGDNPLSGSNNYQVYIRGIEKQEEFVEYVKGLEGVRKVTHSADTVRALLHMKAVVSRLIVGSVGILLFISVLLIHNTLCVAIEAQKEKTRVMRLMGAREAFVRVPFLVEGLVMALAGMCLPLLLLFTCYRWGLEYLSAGLNLYGGRLELLAPSAVFPRLIHASVLLGVAAGVIGGLSVMGKLKKKKQRRA